MACEESNLKLYTQYIFVCIKMHFKIHSAAAYSGFQVRGAWSKEVWGTEVSQWGPGAKTW